MTRTLMWTTGTATIALATALLALARARGGPTRAALDAVEERLGRIEVERSSTRGPSEDEARRERELAQLSVRLERLERDRLDSGARRVPVEAAAGRPAPPAAEGTPRAEPEPAPIDAAASREFEALLALFGPDYDFDGTPEEMQRFYALARDAGLLDRFIADLEARVAGDGGDLEARMELADLYVAKLMIIPHGPEQGIWGERAERQWRAVTELDPDHWKANFSIGHNFAFYPDVMGKTREAIHYLEEARRIQENGHPDDEQVRVYLALSRLYSRQGNEDRSRAVLESGLRRHASNEELLQALDDLDR